MNKEELKELAEIAMENNMSEKKAIELVQWASLKDTRSTKMIEYLSKNPNVSEAKIRYEMSRIVADEQIGE